MSCDNDVKCTIAIMLRLIGAKIGMILSKSTNVKVHGIKSHMWKHSVDSAHNLCTLPDFILVNVYFPHNFIILVFVRRTL